MSVTVEQVLAALSGVKDPATGREIVADQVSDVRVDAAGEATFRIDLISPGFPLRDASRRRCARRSPLATSAARSSGA
ncbi:iron-sulfur cluster assembly protein [Nannocystis pusilla]|uniref:iron-sulfur cluster assembly protein n=1 Tax=Nannocystis pusilla TaxID=889268 RepID=UPI003B807C28